MVKFEGGRTSNLRDEFRERKEYKEYEGFEKFQTIDTHYKDFKYGMMNRNHEPITIIASQEDEVLQNFPNLADDVMVLPFVAQAFNDFREHYTKFIEGGRQNVVHYPKYIIGVVPIRGYVNFSTEFARYVNYNMTIYKAQMALEIAAAARESSLPRLRQGTPNPMSYQTFLEKFFETFEERGQEFPITKSGFITSSHCSILTSGLCIELAEEEYNIDEPKGEMVTTTNYECFADHANEYGFLIDKYVPWRIVADLNSPVMQEYMVRGRSFDISRALDFYESTYTIRSCYDDLYSLNDYLQSIYYSLYPGAINNIILAITIPQSLEVLFRVRSIELGLEHENYTEAKQDLLDKYHRYGLRWTLGYIGEMASTRLKEIYDLNDTTDSRY